VGRRIGREVMAPREDAGLDVAIIEIIFPDGFLRTTTYNLTVK
jgi:hypothetical protein